MLSRWIAAAGRQRGLLSSLRARSYSCERLVDLADRDGELRLFVVAGEVSGDSLAARLMASLRVLCPVPVRFAGIGGDLMCKEGLQSLFPMEEIAIMGLWELLPHIYNVKRKIEDTVDAALSFQPHAVVTVDSKGFSFRFLKQLRCRHSQKVASPLHVHYVAPSFWAWKGGESRLSKMHNFVDHLLCILPFEEEICRLYGLPTTYVGHPLLEDAAGLNADSKLSSDKSMHQRSDENFRLKHGLSPDATILTMLPGSRMQEVSRMLPIFLRTAERLSHTLNKLSLVIPVAPHRDVRTYVENAVQSGPYPVVLIPGGSLEQRYGAFKKKHQVHCLNIIVLEPFDHFHPFDGCEDILKQYTFTTLKSWIAIICSERLALAFSSRPWAIQGPIGLFQEKFRAPLITAANGFFHASKAALCTSGTAVMELMLAKLPCVVAYQAHFITECLIHLRKKINYISLPNILLDSPIVPEILFRACTDKNLAAKLSEVIFNDEVRQLQAKSADEMLQVLYEPIKQRCGLLAQEMGNSSSPSNFCTPSMIAASTVLHMEKNQRMVRRN